MPKGFKDFGEYRINQETKKQLNQSAHPVFKVERFGRNPHKTTTWFTKDLALAQEAQIECMTGEIYRYLIGGAQPKIRVQNETYVASESVDFISFRDLVEKAGYRQFFDGFKKAFCDNIDGFMMVVLAAIFFEENDLSDNNYGVAVQWFDDGREKSKEKDKEKPKVVKEYGGFVKIDHGQSFNTLRILDERAHALGKFPHPIDMAKSSLLQLAEIKYFPPVKPVPAADWRKKAERKSLGALKAGARKYRLSHEFFDRIVMDFADGRVDKEYIIKLTNQPSASPFYDARLLPIIAGLGEERYEKLEVAKYWALAKIAYTSEEAYLHIAKNATETDRIPEIWPKVRDKIRDNHRALLVEVARDLDFLRFCNVFEQYIRERITASWKVIIHKKKEDFYLSERYGAMGGDAVNPIDNAAFAEAVAKGAEYQKPGVMRRTTDLLEGFLDFVGSQKWEVGFMGGTAVTLRGKQVKVPAHIASLVSLLDLYAKCGHRVMRAMQDMVTVIHDAYHSTARTRKGSTAMAYFALYTQVQQYGADLQRLGVSPAALLLIHPMLAP